MEKVKHTFEDDGARDALARPDVREVWEQIAPRLDEATEKARRYEPAKKVWPESVRDYGEDREEENLGLLESTGNPQLVGIYKELLEEYPELCVVKLADQDISRNAFFSASMRDTTTGQVMPVVRMNLSHPETYRMRAREVWIERSEETDDNLPIKFLMKRVALRMGADWRKCVRNRKLTTGMVLLHEMGHAHEFIDEHLTPEYLQREGVEPSERMVQSVIAAVEQVSENRKGYEESSKKVDDSRVARELAYRELPDETYADEFAMAFIERHYGEFFVEGTEEGAREKAVEVARDWAVGEERVRTAVGREMQMDADFAYILGLTEGRSVRVEPVLPPEKKPGPYDMREGDYGIYGYEESKRFDAEGHYVRPKHAKPEHYVGRHQKVGGRGVLMAMPQEGGAIYLREGERAVRVCENASGFRYVSRRGEGGRLVTRVYFDDEEGRKYEMRRSEVEG